MKTITCNECIERLIKQGIETELAIDFVKTTFAKQLCKELNLFRVQAPIAVEENTGINDDLNGIERAVSFPIADMCNSRAVVVQSLAKWKRVRLAQLGIETGKGILTDMRAIRPDEKLSPIHSIFVDQWDWEKVISVGQLNIATLKETVNAIFRAIRKAEHDVFTAYPQIEPFIPENIHFIHSQELLQLFPKLSPKERENEIAKQYGAVFVIGIGDTLTDGKPHDGRAPDYDDWSSQNDLGLTGLNGDIIVWNPVSQSALELSSMGIRVDKLALIRQLSIAGCPEREKLLFHSMLLTDQLPQTIGGGIGQSRLCMFLLRKKHIGEVQVGIWSASTRLAYKHEGIEII